MPSLDSVFPEVLETLTNHFGPNLRQRAAIGTFEVIVATTLSRTVDPRKVQPILDGLRDHGVLEPESLADADRADLAVVFRQVRVAPTPRLLALLGRLALWYAERAESFDGTSTEALRDGLLAINGIGPATCDAILLFALNRPVYPVDRASYRILARHGWIDPTSSYDEARDVLERPADGDPQCLVDLSHWFVRLGKECCRPTVARCDRCPLREFLPEGGPIEPGPSED